MQPPLSLSALNGFYLVDKPVGPSSAAVVGRLKWLINQHLNKDLPTGQNANGKKQKVKIGHGGTLDPLASGLLPIGVGKGTKQLQSLLEGPKTYQFTVRFGAATTTGDAEGNITQTSTIQPQPVHIQAILSQFTGELQQTPPAYSALKIGGQRAYALARAGQEFTLQPRTITIHSLALDEVFTGSATFTARVSKGTYIRVLATDLAKALGTVGHVTRLHRTSHGPFNLSHSICLQTLDLALQNGHIATHLCPLAACLATD